MPIFTEFPTALDGPLAAVPTSTTAITTTDTLIYSMEVSNPTAGAITFTLTDGQSSPVAFFNALSIPAGGIVSIDERQGMLFTDGLKWAAGGAGLVATYRIRARVS